MHLIPTLLSGFAIILSMFTLFQVNQIQDSAGSYQQSLTTLLLDRAKSCSLSNQEVDQKEDLFKLISLLDANGSVIESGSDDLRIKYVATQGAIEHVLACAMVLGEIDHLVGVIHTPTPATPLCTQVEHLDEELLDASIRYDLQKLVTVRSRAVIIREYLELGGKLFIAYPQGGLEKRTEQQQEIYKQELARYADRLVDSVLSCKEMDASKVGATYFFKAGSEEIYAFSIKANQANHPEQFSEWGMWLGKIENQSIKDRVSEILDYLTEHAGPDPLAEFRA